MPDKQFIKKLIESDVPNNSILDISNGGKVLIMSDLHMGFGKRDDLDRNGDLVTSILENYYFKDGWTLVLNGDIEELHKFPLSKIREKWKDLYRVYDMFAKEGRLFKIIGNHDEIHDFKRSQDYPYHLHEIVKIKTDAVSAFIFHGHQLSKIYSMFNRFFGIMVKFIAKPLGIMNITDARNPHRRFDIEKKAYNFSMVNHCLSIIGHTHRPLFESLGRFDYIKFEIERLCHEYPTSQGETREFIETEVSSLRKELGKLKRKEKRDMLRQSLYGDELPVPCLFNSGCALGKKGINAIEMTNKDISLIYWFKEGKCKKFVARGNYKIDGIPDQPYFRVVLNHNKLDYISAKIKLLGN